MELVVFEVVFEDGSFDVIWELVDALELPDLESVLLVLLFEDAVVFGKVEVLEDELVLVVESTCEEDVFLDRVLEDVDLEETLEEKVVLEEEDTLMELEPRARDDELLIFEDDSELKLSDVESGVECV
ncbi:hypothetical protein KCU95_g391, partial [Aureobasidium melanogenum]